MLSAVTDFPIISETSLGEARKRWGGIIPSIREGLPQPQAGTVLVFGDGRRWTQARGRVKGTEDFVVDATTVTIVQTRTRTMDVDVAIPSADHADDFTVMASFQCRVTSPELVAEQGPIDVIALLRSYLQQDNELMVRGIKHTVEQVHEVRRLVQARVRAYYDEFAPRIPGLETTLVSVQVLTPADLRKHAEGIRDARWARELAELVGQHEDADAQRLAERLRDPEYVAALAVGRDKIDLGRLVESVYADRTTKDANLLEFLKLLEKNGQLDRMPIDGQVLVTRLVERLGGATGPAGPPGPAIGAGTSTAADGTRSIEGSATSTEANEATADDASTDDRFRADDRDL
jgi:hypothetical protein